MSNQEKKLHTKPIIIIIIIIITTVMNNSNITIVILLYNYPLKPMKNGKASGINSLQAELLKADTTTASLVLTNFFAKIWNHEVIPIDWSMGIYLAECTDPKRGGGGGGGGIVIFSHF